MKVYYNNGDVQDIAIRAQIRQGAVSRVIDLDGGLRNIKRIEFLYETKGFRKRSSRVGISNCRHGRRDSGR